MSQAVSNDCSQLFCDIIQKTKSMPHKENLNKKKVRFVSAVSFVFGFLDAFFIYILSTFFAEVSGSDNVSVFYLLAYVVVLGSLFYLQPLIRIIGRARALYLSLGLSICASAVLASATSAYISLGAALLLLIATNVTWVTLDILLESFSEDKVSGSIRGLYLTIMNAGLLIAPVLSVKTLESYDYSGIFLALVIGYTIIFIATLVGFRLDNRTIQKKIRFRATLKKMLASRNLSRIYHVSLALEFFYALMIVYTPLYLRESGFAWSEIGIIFTVMLLPFVLLQYPLGRLADRYFGEKEMLIGSIAIAAAATFILPFLAPGDIVVWGTALFMTRVGLAGIEILRDSYFYKQIGPDDMDIIAFFRTARPVANILAALLSALMLAVFPVQSIFFLVAIVLFVALFETCFLHDTTVHPEATHTYTS